MDHNNVVSSTKTKLEQALERYKANLQSLRTGRADPSILDNVVVEAYGTTMPLKQLASISAPEAQLIQITPFDPTNLAAISQAIRNDSSLGLNPADDGRVIRLPIPPLSEERRKELAKQVGQKQEESMISVRNIRREAMDVIDKAKKDKTIGEDESKRLINQTEENINNIHKQIETISKNKQSEIMTI